MNTMHPSLSAWNLYKILVFTAILASLVGPGQAASAFQACQAYRLAHCPACRPACHLACRGSQGRRCSLRNTGMRPSHGKWQFYDASLVVGYGLIGIDSPSDPSRNYCKTEELLSIDKKMGRHVWHSTFCCQSQRNIKNSQQCTGLFIWIASLC